MRRVRKHQPPSLSERKHALDIPPGMRLLLVDDDAQHARGIERVLQSAQAVVDVRASLDDLRDTDDWDLLLLNVDPVSVTKTTATLLDALRDRGPLLTYSAERKRDVVAFLVGQTSLTNLLARNGDVDPEELFVTIEKILSNDIFGLGKYFPRGAEQQRLSLNRSADKNRVVDAARDFVLQVGVQPRFAEQFCTVADELTTNAVFNAPVDENGKSRFAHMSRTRDVALRDGERIDIELACDGRQVGISVTDPFGSLTVDTVQAHLAKCFRKDKDQVDEKDGGAGLGLYYAFELLSQFVVNLRVSERTEMIGLLDIRGTYRDFASHAKSFNLFVEKESAPCPSHSK